MAAPICIVLHYFICIGNDVELADNKEFRNAQRYSTDKTELTIDKSAFGQNGGRFYVRIRVRK